MNRIIKSLSLIFVIACASKSDAMFPAIANRLRTFAPSIAQRMNIKTLHAHTGSIRSLATKSRLLTLSGLGFSTVMGLNEYINQDINSPIPGASYYKVHGKKHCEHPKPYLTILLSTEKCPEHAQIKELLDKTSSEDACVITVHDRSKKIIYCKFYEQCSIGKCSEKEKRLLDPKARPMAVRAKIVNCLKRGRSIWFYDEDGQTLFAQRYSGSIELTSEDRKKFEEFIDLSQLKEIKDKTKWYENIIKKF